MSWLVLAGIAFVGGSLIGGLILVRNKPEDMGQVPDGIQVEALDESVLMKQQLEAELATWQTKQVLRQPTTWLIVVFTICYAFALGATGAHQVAFIRDIGFSPMVAATTLSMVSVMAIFSSLGFGALALRFELRYLASACFAVQLVSLVILLTTKGLASIYIYAAFFGAGNGALLVSLTIFVATYYGRASYARVLGIMLPFQVISQASATVIVGVIYDATATYRPAFILMASLTLVGLICALLARRPNVLRANG
jgi:cyanate permease